MSWGFLSQDKNLENYFEDDLWSKRRIKLFQNFVGSFFPIILLFLKIILIAIYTFNLIYEYFWVWVSGNLITDALQVRSVLLDAPSMNRINEIIEVIIVKFKKLRFNSRLSLLVSSFLDLVDFLLITILVLDFSHLIIR